MKKKTYWVDINSVPIEATSREEAEKIYLKLIKNEIKMSEILNNFKIN